MRAGAFSLHLVRRDPGGHTVILRMRRGHGRVIPKKTDPGDHAGGCTARLEALATRRCESGLKLDTHDIFSTSPPPVFQDPRGARPFRSRLVVCVHAPRAAAWMRQVRTCRAGLFQGAECGGLPKEKGRLCEMPREWRSRVVRACVMAGRIVVTSIGRVSALERKSGNPVHLSKAGIEGRQQACEILLQGPGWIGDDQPGAGETPPSSAGLRTRASILSTGRDRVSSAPSAALTAACCLIGYQPA